MAESSEQELLAGARGGDRAALEELLRRYQPRVYRFGMRLLPGGVRIAQTDTRALSAHARAHAI